MLPENWEFERSSGFAGYRCKKCYTWIYAGKPFVCECGGNPKQSLSDVLMETRLFLYDNYKGTEYIVQDLCDRIGAELEKLGTEG